MDNPMQVKWRGHTINVREMLIRDRERILRLTRVLAARLGDDEEAQLYSYLTAVVLIVSGDENIWKRPAPTADLQALTAGYEAWGGLPVSLMEKLAQAFYALDDEEPAAKN